MKSIILDSSDLSFESEDSFREKGHLGTKGQDRIFKELYNLEYDYN